jgi:DNA-binding MarR family transcriptional regulator
MGACRFEIMKFANSFNQMSPVDHNQGQPRVHRQKTSNKRNRSGSRELAQTIRQQRSGSAAHFFRRENKGLGAFVLEDQVGFLLRAVSQRNTILFAEGMVAGLTRVQFTTIAKLLEIGSCSQNELGRLILMDRATIKGVVSRLRKRGLIQVLPDPRDRRHHALGLTNLGHKTAQRAVAVAPTITEKMLERLNSSERKQIIKLLRKIVM